MQAVAGSEQHSVRICSVAFMKRSRLEATYQDNEPDAGAGLRLWHPDTLLKSGMMEPTLMESAPLGVVVMTRPR